MVDGTDFRISGPHPFVKTFNRKHCSHKFDGPGLRCEVGVSILTGFVVWCHGPFPAGMSDLQIIGMKLQHISQIVEKVIAGCGSRSNPKCVCPDDCLDDMHEKAMGEARARHECICRRFEEWKILRERFRHHRSKHQEVFKAIAAIKQMEIEDGDPPFQVEICFDPVVV